MKSHYLFFFFIAALLSSCSAIGYGIGSLIDHGAAHDTVAIFTDISDYTGQKVRIIYPDSLVQNATFINYSDEPAGSYKKSYEQYYSSHRQSPAAIGLGDTVMAEKFFSDGGFRKKSGVFEGYFPEGILLADDKWLVEKFDSVAGPKTLSMPQLKQMFELNLVPIRATLHFKTKEKYFALTNSDFQNVQVMPRSAPWRWILLGVGAAVDVAIIAAIIAVSINPPSQWGFGY